MYTLQLKKSTHTRTNTGPATEALASVMPPQQPDMQQRQQRRYSADNPHSKGVDANQLARRLRSAAVTFSEPPESSPHLTIDNDSRASVRPHIDGSPGDRFVYNRMPLGWVDIQHFSSDQGVSGTSTSGATLAEPQLRTVELPEMQQRHVAARPSAVVKSQVALKSQLVFVDGGSDVGQGSRQVSRQPVVIDSGGPHANRMYQAVSSAARAVTGTAAVPSAGNVRGASVLPPAGFTTASLSSQRQVTSTEAMPIPAVSAPFSAPFAAPLSAPLSTSFSAIPIDLAHPSEPPASVNSKPQMVEIKRRDRYSAVRRRSQGSTRRAKSTSQERLMTGKDMAAHVSAAEPTQPEVHVPTTPAQPPAHAPDAQGPKPHAPPLSTEPKAPTEPRALAIPRSRRTSTLEPARSRMPKSDDVKKLDQEWTKGGKEVIRRHQAVEILMHTSGDSLADEDIVPRDDIERHNIESYVTDAGYDLAGMSIAESDIGSFALSELDDGPDRDAHNYVIRVDGKEVSMKDPSDGSTKGMAEAAAEAEAVAATAAKSAARPAAPGVQESAEIVSFSDLLNNDVFGSWTSSGMPTQANTAVQSTVHSNRHLIMVPVEKEESGFLLEPLQEQQESAASIHASNAAIQQASRVSLLETSKQPSEPTAAATQASNEADFRMSLLRRRSNGLDVSASKAGTMPQYQFPTQPDSAATERQPDSHAISVRYIADGLLSQTPNQSSLPEGMPSFYHPGHNDKTGDCCEVPAECPNPFPKLSPGSSFFSAGRRSSMAEPARPEPWESPGKAARDTSGLRRRRATVTGNMSASGTRQSETETAGQSTAHEASSSDREAKTSRGPVPDPKSQLKHRSQRASTAHSRSPTLLTVSAEANKAVMVQMPPPSPAPPLPQQSRQMAQAGRPADISEMQVLDLDPESDANSNTDLEIACCDCFSCRCSFWSSSSRHARKRNKRHMSGRPRMVPVQVPAANTQRPGASVAVDSAGRNPLVDSSWRHVYRSHRPSSMATSRRSGTVRAALASPFHLCYNCLLWWLGPCVCASNSNNGCC